MSSEKRKKSKFQRLIYLNETFSNEEIKNLRNLNVEINSLFKIPSNRRYINNSINNFNSTSSIVMPKEKFYKIMLEEMQKNFIKEKNWIMSKITGLLIKEIINIAKLIEENIILNDFFDSLQKRKASNVDTRKKYKNLNLSIYNVNNNKPENDLAERTRAQSQKHSLLSENNKNNSDNIKIFKEVKFSNKAQINKKILYSNDILDAKKLNYENENGGTDSRCLNDNKTNYIFNITNAENVISTNKPKIISNEPKKAYHNINYKKRNIFKDNNCNNSNKSNAFSKGKISMKRKQNKSLYVKHNEKENDIHKNINKSIKKRIKFNIEQFNNDEKDSLNKSCSTKKSNYDENSDRLSPNISIVKFLNENSEILNNIEAINFDIFHLDQKIGQENTLSLIGYYIFNRFGFYNIINFNKFEKWCKKISEGYIRANPYHTDLHAADITHTCLLYFKIGKVNEICKLTKSSKCSLFLSCMCHDYKHPGVNNNFLKDTKNELSLTYNDNSILENMHIAETFKLINAKEDYNIFDKVDIDTYKQMRKEMISCVLATDMTFHNFYVDFMKEQIKIISDKNDNDKDNKKAYQNYMNLLIHSADISNPTKPFDIYFKWAKLVVNEFYEQGDKEKELGLVCSCDRNKVTIYQSQLGFINYIELPYFSLFAELFKKLKFYYDTLNSNKDKLINMQQEDNNNGKEQ